MSDAARSYVPAAGRDWLLPFYDPLQWVLRGHRIRRAMLDAAELRPGLRVLDVGCGTGTMVVDLKRSHPELAVTGIDPDPLALARARRKLARAGLDVRLDEGFADRLPYPDASFDRVFSSFMFHHLDAATKDGMLREVRRVLAPGGALHLVDFGGGDEREGLMRLFHSHDELRDNFGGRIPARMRAAGFEQAREVSHRRIVLGRVTHYEAR